MRSRPLTWINSDKFAIFRKSVPWGHRLLRRCLRPLGILLFVMLLCDCGGHLGEGDGAGVQGVLGPGGGDGSAVPLTPGCSLMPSILGGSAGSRGGGGGLGAVPRLRGVGHPVPLLLLGVLLALLLVLPLPILVLTLLVFLPLLGALAVLGWRRITVGARRGQGLRCGREGSAGLFAGRGGRGQACGPHGAGEGGDAAAAEAQAGEERAGDHRGHRRLAAAG